MNKLYDLVFSLGANCSSANNLVRRKLRPFACPFDWVYFMDDSTLRYFASSIRTRFHDLMLKENLVQIEPGHPEWNETHKDFLKYHDLKSGYRFVNHFKAKIDTPGEYDRVYATLRRRIDRLFKTIEKRNEFLLVFATGVQIAPEVLISIQEAFKVEFPGKRFDIEGLQFSAQETKDVVVRDGIIVHNHTREINLYDMLRTNYEWAFLDNVASRLKPRRQRIAFHLLPHLRMEIHWKRV